MFDHVWITCPLLLRGQETGTTGRRFDSEMCPKMSKMSTNSHEFHWDPMSLASLVNGTGDPSKIRVASTLSGTGTDVKVGIVQYAFFSACN